MTKRDPFVCMQCDYPKGGCVCVDVGTLCNLKDVPVGFVVECVQISTDTDKYSALRVGDQYLVIGGTNTHVLDRDTHFLTYKNGSELVRVVG